MISRRKLAASIAERLNSDESQSLIIKQLAAYIIEHNLESEADRIVADINSQLVRYGKVLTKVVTARPLDSSTRQQIIDYMQQSTGDKVEVVLSESVDPEIIGGIIIETPDQRLDISVVSQLKQLHNA